MVATSQANGARLTGQEIVDGFWHGRGFLTMGRIGGLQGAKLAEDIASGDWWARIYQVGSEPEPANHNWFKVEEFIQLVEGLGVTTTAPGPGFSNAKLTGNEIVDEFISVDGCGFLTMGRIGGLHGERLAVDVDSGDWRQQLYQVSSEPEPTNRNWFMVQEFIYLVAGMVPARAVTFQEARAIVQETLPEGLTTSEEGWENEEFFKVNIAQPLLGGYTYFVTKATGELVLKGEYLPGTKIGDIIDAMTKVEQSDQDSNQRETVQTIMFSDALGELGKVVIDGQSIQPELPVAGIVRAYKQRGATADEFVERYSDWSNGYVSSKLVTEKTGVAQERRPASPLSTAALITKYGQSFNRMFTTDHSVASPLGVWLLLALAAPATEGSQRAALEAQLGTSAADAAERATQLLSTDHPAVGCAFAVWAHQQLLNTKWDIWSSGLPPAVECGPMPDQGAADHWTSTHSKNLIKEFPVTLFPELTLPLEDDDVATALVLASVLATAVTWTHPFTLVPGSDLEGPFGRLVTHALAAHGTHSCLLVDTQAAGLVGVHSVDTVDGLAVISVIAAPDIPADAVHNAAGQVAALLAGAGAHAHRVSLFDVPLGDGAAWTVSEGWEKRYGVRTDRAEEVSAVLAPWSADSEHDILAAPGIPEVLPALEAMVRWESLPGGFVAEFEAKQVATAKYSRTGFTAAAVTALAMSVKLGSALVSNTVLTRRATIRFNRPYAVIAVARNEAVDVERRRGIRNMGAPDWANIPVFCAWVARPQD